MTDTPMHVRAARWIMARSQPAFHLELARRRVVSRFTRGGTVERYLRTANPRGLQLGTGHNPRVTLADALGLDKAAGMLINYRLRQLIGDALGAQRSIGDQIVRR